MGWEIIYYNSGPGNMFLFFWNPHSLIQRIRLRVLPQGVKWHWRETDNSHPSIGEVKEVLRYTSLLCVKGGLELPI